MILLKRKAVSCLSQKKEKLHTIYGIILSVLIIVTGLAFIISCILIYKTEGDQPFTYKSIGEYFNNIAIPVFLTIGGLIGGVIINLLYPMCDTKLESRGQTKGSSLLLRKVTAEDCDAESAELLKKEVRFSRICRALAGAIVIISSIVSLIIALDLSRYGTDNINEDIIAIVLIILPLSLLSITAVFAASMLIKASTARRVDIVKKVIKDKPSILKEKKEDTEKDSTLRRFKKFYQKNERKILFSVRSAVLILAVTFIILGIFNGGMAEVLGKAVRICTECIGLGLYEKDILKNQIGSADKKKADSAILCSAF